MHSALLAALALAGVPLELPEQRAFSDVAWPTHAVIAAPQGSIKSDEQLFVLEDGRPMLAQVEVAARWPDGSPKWLHAYGLFRYAGGKAASYTFEHAAKLPGEMPASPLVVTDDAQGIEIDTGVIRLVIPRPFVGIALLSRDGKPLVRGVGGPSLIDGEGTTWHAMHDREAEITVEQKGPAQVTVKATGWYQTPKAREDAFCRFTTRITATAGSPIVKIDHATTFADDMKKHAVAELAFTFPLVEARAFSSSTLRGAFSDKVRAVYLAQLTDDRLWRIVERGPSGEAQSRGDYERSAGWFSATVGGNRVALVTKDFWQKCPKEVKLSPGELVYYAWPKHGELASDDPDATRPEKVYKFQCFHRGDQLHSQLPKEYFEALKNQKDTKECKPEYAEAANLQGVSMRNEFALAVVPEGADAQALDDRLDRLARLYVQNPTARVSPGEIAASGALGPVAAAGSHPFDQLEQTAVRNMLGYARSIPRYGDYGWAIYGNTHHGELMNPSAAGVAGGRPSLHRVWNNNHYQHVSTSWRLWALNGDGRLLGWARTCTDNYTSIGQVRYDKQWFALPPDQPRRPSVKYHYPGAFYHCKGLVPWGGRPYGVEANDVDAYWTGHWPDPTALLLAWLLDADRWAKDGYELWLSEVKLPKGGSSREANTTLVHMIQAYQYRPKPEFLEAIRVTAAGLMSQPIRVQLPGPIWEPTWLSRYYELFPEDEAFKKFLIASAEELGTGAEGVASLAVSATAYQITKDPKYLLGHAGQLERMRRRLFHDPSGRWQDYGNPPGPTGDQHFGLQWHRFARALVDAGIKKLEIPEEAGTYLGSVTRFDHDGDVSARGTTILFHKPSDAHMPLVLDGMGLPQADIAATSLRLLSPTRRSLWYIERIGMSMGQRQIALKPSYWNAARETYGVEGPAGVYTLLIGSDQSFFQGISSGPECQLVRNERVPNWREPVRHRCRITKGWLVPLTQSPITLEFAATGERDGSYAAVEPTGAAKSGAVKWERWLVAGKSDRATLEPSQGPWKLEIHGDRTSVTDLVVKARVPVPLLYGRKLEDVQAIRKILLGTSGGG
jgi:hypothetical protein